jgi:hypothetical protein
MTTPTRKRKRWLIPLIVLGTIYVVVSSTIATIKTYHERRAEQEAKRWLIQAEQDAELSWTEDDAVSWLHQHGFENVSKGEGVSSAVGRPDEHFFSVIGWRQFEKGGVIVRPSSVYVEFYFDMNHGFMRVRSKAWPFEPPEKPSPKDQGPGDLVDQLARLGATGGPGVYHSKTSAAALPAEEAPPFCVIT